MSMLQIDKLLQKVAASRPADDLTLLRKAYEFSAREHQAQKRLSGEPYLSHPLEVANILADMRLDVVCLAAGMLHDVVEDTPATIDQVRQEFGPEVARIVEGVTKISRIEFFSPEDKQAENLRKMVDRFITCRRLTTCRRKNVSGSHEKLSKFMRRSLTVSEWGRCGASWRIWLSNTWNPKPTMRSSGRWKAVAK